MYKGIFVSLFVLLSSFLGSAYAESPFPEGEKRMFTITGYYSPLPNQNFYITGNYESEIRLNGKGIMGADGTGVYPGMMAASRDYAFGTKICLPHFGCGAVHDRGQAIVSKGKRKLAVHDRLDLWMGYGEEGLLRALAWGVKHYEGEVHAPGSQIVEAVNFEAALPLYAVLDIPDKPVYEKNLHIGNQGAEVQPLQEALTSLGYYQGAIDGIYDTELKNALYDFQKRSFIVDSRRSVGAGMFGPQTREVLSKEVHRWDIQSAISQAWNRFHFEDPLAKGMRNADVLRLQELLVREEFLDAYPTSYFGPLTKQALIDFQLYYDIIQSPQDYGAGKVGPLTRAKLNERIEITQKETRSEEKAVLAYQKTQNQFQHLVQNHFTIDGYLAYGSEGTSVHKLQSILYEMGYLDHAPSGFFGHLTRTALKQFQLEHQIISSPRDRGAGTFGPGTRAVLQEVIQG